MAEICNIYGQTDSYGNCCVTPHHRPLEKQALRQHRRGLLSGYKVPDRIFLKRELPLTPTGKLMRRALRAEATLAVQNAEVAKDR